MTIEFSFRALQMWPGPPTQTRRRAPFKAGYAVTLKEMTRELSHLDARSVVIEADCADADIRMDGRLRSSARMRGPGIVLAFESKHGPLRYPCDTYLEWTDNLRAIVLAMAALRAVDRYGVTRRGEQYRGWKQLPGGSSPAIVAEEWATAEQAWSFLKQTAGISVAGTLEATFRQAAKYAHPDAGGSDELMARVGRARDYIKRTTGVLK